MLPNQKFHKCKASNLLLCKLRGSTVRGVQSSCALITRALKVLVQLGPKEALLWGAHSVRGGSWPSVARVRYRWGKVCAVLQTESARTLSFLYNLFQALWFSAYSSCTYFVRCNPKSWCHCKWYYFLFQSSAVRCKYTEIKVFAFWPS